MVWWLIGISHPPLKILDPLLRAVCELSLFSVEIDQSNYHYIKTNILKNVGLKLAEDRTQCQPVSTVFTVSNSQFQ